MCHWLECKDILFGPKCSISPRYFTSEHRRKYEPLKIKINRSAPTFLTLSWTLSHCQKFLQTSCIILQFLPNPLRNIAWACLAEMWTSSVCCPEGKWAWGPCGCGLMCAYMSRQRWTLLLPRPLRLQLTHLRLIHNHRSTNHAHLSPLYLNPSLRVWPRIIIRWLSLKRIL